MMNLKKGKKILSVALLFIMIVSCRHEHKTPNSLDDQEISDGWQLLFDGVSLKNWHIYNKGNANSAWTVQNGELYCDPNSESDKGDLVTDVVYKDYELKFDWKLEKEGNSGVFINVQERPDINTTFQSGPEYQLLEDSHIDFDKPMKRSGCLYTFLPQKNLVDTKRKKEWNTSRIIQKDGKMTFYLNDVITSEMDFKSEQWKDMVRKSNFKDYPEFGNHIQGQIALQDWSRGVSFRNIKIKEL